jgi:hypothetical protein
MGGLFARIGGPRLLKFRLAIPRAKLVFLEGRPNGVNAYVAVEQITANRMHSSDVFNWESAMLNEVDSRAMCALQLKFVEVNWDH